MCPEAPKLIDFTIEPSAAGRRLDSTLAAGLAARSLSRSRLQALIEGGHVRLLAKPALKIEAARRVKTGEIYRLSLPPAAAAEPKAQAIPLAVIFEDEDLIVIDKPAGLVVHPAAGNPDRTLVNALLAHCGTSLSGIGGVARPGIVHRLDKDTSGLLIAAKTDLAHQGLAAQFASHGRDGRLIRAYQAFVFGVPSPAHGQIDAPIGRNPHNRKAFAVIPKGKFALTHYRVLARYGTGGAAASLVECRLQTGRTHQIRVHLSHIGHPVLGDPVYRLKHRRGSAFDSMARTLGRQALHAAELGFEHPRSQKKLLFKSPLPLDMAALQQNLEGL